MGRELRLWPLLVLLLVAVLVPTASLLWMMSKAIDNERLAVRQILAEVCRGQFVRLHSHWHEQWQALAKQLDDAAEGKSPPAAFAAILRDGLADSAIFRDAAGRRVYPAAPSPPAEEASDGAAWTRALESENVAHKPLEAAQLYADIANIAADANIAARALMAQARSLAQGGRLEEAIDILANRLASARFSRAVDRDGRLIAADAELRSLELIGDRTDPRYQEIADRLGRRLADYFDGSLGPAQRRFLMNELLQLIGQTFPTLQGEELAAALVESAAPLRGTSILQPTGVPNLWQFASSDGRIIALFRTETVLGKLHALTTKEDLPSGVQVELVPPDQPAELSGFLHVLPAGDWQPGWQLALAWNDEELVNATAGGKIAAYLLAGILAIAAASLLALSIAVTLGRQMRLARLKNDLLATVSHELKTPLTSMRLLVDTLLADETPDRQREREYLELVAKENARLSRLIDNFLTFSRMQRNKQTFTFAEVAPATIVQSAADAVRERFAQAGCSFHVEVEPNLPPISADVDALVTAIVNLLDNAYKYSGHDKQITLRASADGRNRAVVFDVSDNGIGLSRAERKKVFQRFYQVDRELSRSQGGCGLGLSIVDSIVKGHGGEVSVRSQPHKGSTFTIAIPVCGQQSVERKMSL